MKAGKNYGIVILILMLGLTVMFQYGCSGTETPVPETPVQIIEDITAEEAYNLIQENRDNPDFKIIDVRTPDEYTEGHIENAILIDINGDDFDEKIGQLDKDGTYVVYCRSGNRSGRACAAMQVLGFREVYNIIEGIRGWESAGLPTVK